LLSDYGTTDKAKSISLDVLDKRREEEEGERQAVETAEVGQASLGPPAGGLYPDLSSLM